LDGKTAHAATVPAAGLEQIVRITQRYIDSAIFFAAIETNTLNRGHSKDCGGNG
jgi:hypothetical protein